MFLETEIFGQKMSYKNQTISIIFTPTNRLKARWISIMLKGSFNQTKI